MSKLKTKVLTWRRILDTWLAGACQLSVLGFPGEVNAVRPLFVGDVIDVRLRLFILALHVDDFQVLLKVR